MSTGKGDIFGLPLMQRTTNYKLEWNTPVSIIFSTCVKATTSPIVNCVTSVYYNIVKMYYDVSMYHCLHSHTGEINTINKHTRNPHLLHTSKPHLL